MTINVPDARLFTMFVSWVLAFYGVRRRDWPGSVTALVGLGLAGAAMTIGRDELREQ